MMDDMHEITIKLVVCLVVRAYQISHGRNPPTQTWTEETRLDEGI